MDWSGPELPKANDLEGTVVLDEGEMHIRTIQRNDGQILGWRPLELDGIRPRLCLDESPDSPTCHVKLGATPIGLATQEQRRTLTVYSTWGYGVIKLLAERRFVTGASR